MSKPTIKLVLDASFDIHLQNINQKHASTTGTSESTTQGDDCGPSKEMTLK